MSDDLYQQAILDRAKSTAHAGRLEAPDATITLDNPLCGDRVTLDLRLAEGRITQLSHHVRGCALCQASAAVMAEAATGQTVDAARTGAAALQSLMGGGAAPAPWAALEIFAPVRRHKARQDCVKLPFDALDKALAQARKT